MTEAPAEPSPWRSALRNSRAALIPIALGGACYLVKFGLRGGLWDGSKWFAPPAWWARPAVAAFVVGACFAHAALEVAIGRRRADVAAKLVLAAGLVGGVWVLTHVLDQSRPR